MGLTLEEMELETSELLPAREVMGCLNLSLCISIKVSCEPSCPPPSCHPCPPPPCHPYCPPQPCGGGQPTLR